MGLFCAKSLSHQNLKNPSFPGVFLSGTQNPGFKILPRIGNTSVKQRDPYRSYLALIFWLGSTTLWPLFRKHIDYDVHNEASNPFQLTV